ncbi:glycosyltransferase family 2 protein [Gordonia sp. 'Campus']|uniref:glycosyltransferase family 2 protein n=1 Tax=Gordonia sp. 'Campus' TaxID=2915824 RepID=UPI001EE4BE77|nr:glycosyltransferase family 2 protein [Gordonia sp. 'Campus']
MSNEERYPVKGKYLISVATYMRPEGLGRLLDSLAVGTNSCADVVIVDNDPVGSARALAEAHPAATYYTIQPEAGIAQARNAGLEFFTTEYDGIIFVDDDEWVDEGWLYALTSYLVTSGADVVQGPVMTVLPEDCPEWIRRGGFFQRERVASGFRLLSAATNNTIMTRNAWVRAGEPRFDTSFSETGGSDWDFFWGLRLSGALIVYCNEAIVSEDVPASRLNARWLIRRSTRSGIVHSRVRVKYCDHPYRAVLKGIPRAGYYALLLMRGIVVSRMIPAKPFNVMSFEVGKVLGLAGYRTYEYRRTDDGVSVA